MINKKSIFLTGLLSARVGGLEVGNLGNFAIIDPFIDQLKQEFPHHTIRTSFQLSNPYESEKGIHCLRDERFWNYGLYTAKETVLDFIRVGFFKISKLFSKSGKTTILQKSKLLSEILDADFVIDFSGDVFGENAKYNVFLEGAAKLYFSLLLKKKVFVLASSPGPFEKRYKRIIMKYLYSRTELILNREPLTTEILLSMGLPDKLVGTSACPSYLFQGYAPKKTVDLLREQGIKDEDALIGFILTGWNLPVAPYNKIPREETELKGFIDYLKFLHDTFDCKVLLMSHANKTDDIGKMSYGNDYFILKQIYELLPQQYKDRIILLDKVLDARTSKSVIGNFDMLISGRLHGAIAGISQAIPTIVIDYGHEPKAHKLRGFLKLLDYEKFLVAPENLGRLKEVTKEMWETRPNIKTFIKMRVAEVQNASLRNFTMIKEKMK